MQTAPRSSRNPKRATSLYQARWLVVFLGLPLLLYSVWVIYPFVRTFTLAFASYDGLSPAQWIGWQNFREMFQTEAFRLALWHNLIWILIFITVPTSAGLGLAMVLNQGVRFDRFLKIAYYLPLVLAPVVTAMVWGWIPSPAGPGQHRDRRIFGCVEDARIQRQSRRRQEYRLAGGS